MPYNPPAQGIAFLTNTGDGLYRYPVSAVRAAEGDVTMEPVTTAIIAGILAGVTKSAGGVAEKAVVDAYNGLKELIQRKFGKDSRLVRTVRDLEEVPDSEAYKMAIQEQVQRSQAGDDPEIRAAAEALIEKVASQPGGQTVLNAVGSNIAQAAYGSTASVNVNQPNPPSPPTPLP